MGSSALGYAACAVGVLGFGTSFVPVKKFKTHDGFFFQWLMCVGIFLAGLIVQAVRDSPKFHFIACFGGFLWCTGNVMCPIIIRLIGMGLGLSIWGTTALLMGWATGFFGLFGLEKEPVPHPVMNVIGVVFAIAATFAFAAVDTTSSEEPEPEIRSGSPTSIVSSVVSGRYGGINEPLLPVSGSATFAAKAAVERDFFESLPSVTKRVAGCTMAAVAGLFFGANFTPEEYAMDHHKHNSDYSQNGVDYVFAQFTGIFVASTIYMFLYAMFMRNKPVINPELVLPGTLSGVIWSVAQIAMTVANTQLGLVVSFPIISVGPGLVANLIGILVFREIRGRRNFTLLAIAFALTFTGVALITASKQ